MKKIIVLVLFLLLIAGCQEKREMAPDDVNEEQTYVQALDVHDEK